MIKTQLVDATNFDHFEPIVRAELGAAQLVGVDCETHDDNRHEGLNRFCGYDPVTRRKPKNKPTVFDMRRIEICGASIHVDGSDTAYYFNLGHADAQNRIPHGRFRRLLEAKSPDAIWVAHNAPFERTVFKRCLDWDFGPQLICSLQLCVSAYNPDEYSSERFMGASLNGFRGLLPELMRVSVNYDPKRAMTPEQFKVFNKIVGKESDAEHSYNGWVDSIAYGYGLKQVVKSWFGVDMTTYEQALRGMAHMGQLTGAEVTDYGADDAYWAVRVYKRIMDYMMATNPAAVETFFVQENPMTEVFSDIWLGGMKVDLQAVNKRRHNERADFAAELRKLRMAIREALPFSTAPAASMIDREDWYQKNWASYRARIATWAMMTNAPTDYDECLRVSGSVSNNWVAELEPTRRKLGGINFTHYMVARTLLYDLLGAKLVVSDGKVMSDGEARGKIKEQLGTSAIIDSLNELAGIEQRMKLYLAPYEQLTDPDTQRLYPVVSCMLATRRMGARYPNPMQLAKRGASTYVRGFFEADNDDHLVLSVDMSGIELVLIGEFSGDDGFREAFGQVPHQDMHSKAATALLRVETGREFDIPTFKRLPFMTKEEAYDIFGEKAFINAKGQEMGLADAYKFHRGNDGGKGANFNYWYSGALGTIGEKRGWTEEQMWKAVEAYRAEFPKAESWRIGVIEEACSKGFVALPDHHRRARFEATPAWILFWLNKWAAISQTEGFQAFMAQVARKIQTRAKNQAVNAKIQGSCATILKRSILRIQEETKGWDMRFMIPIHDEVVFSVHRSLVVPAIHLIKRALCTHPEIISNLQMDASPSIGVTFEPWDVKKAPYGQVELHEAPRLPGILPEDTVGKRLSDDQIEAVVDYLMASKQRMRLAA